VEREGKQKEEGRKRRREKGDTSTVLTLLPQLTLPLSYSGFNQHLLDPPKV